MSERRLSKEWSVAAFNRETNEWDATTLQSYEYVNDLSQDFTPATPAKITPSRRKPVEKDYTSIFVLSDLQVGYRRIIDHETQQSELMPLHDERAMKVARFICRELRPDIIVNLGDSIDLAELSRFKPDSDHFHATLGPSFQRIHDYYAELRADNPDARIIEVSSNHNQRLNDFILKNAPQFYNLHHPNDKSHPVLSYPYLADLDHVGVEWIGGYPAGQFEYGEESPIIFRHGTESSSNGTTAAKIMKNHPETHNVHGHAHEIGESWHTLRDGRMLGSFVVGALCSITGSVPGYHSAVNDHNRPVDIQNNWQQGVMHIRDHGSGRYEFNQIPIENGIAYYEGKEYTVD